MDKIIDDVFTELATNLEKELRELVEKNVDEYVIMQLNSNGAGAFTARDYREGAELVIKNVVSKLKGIV